MGDTPATATALGSRLQPTILTARPWIFAKKPSRAERRSASSTFIDRISPTEPTDCPLTRPSDTLSPSAEGWAEGAVRIVETDTGIDAQLSRRPYTVRPMGSP